MESFIAQLINGLSTGGIYALIVLGMNLLMLVRNIVQICKSCGMTCIAEGVETRAQIDALLREGCQFCQGYYFAKPMSVQAFEERYLLHSHRT